MHDMIIDPVLYLEVQQFLIWEAELLDNLEFEEWFELLTEDIKYSSPVRKTRYRRDGDGFTKKSALFSDNHHTLKMRVMHHRSKFAWSEDPPSRTRHFISNIRIKHGDNEGEIKVCSNLLLYRSRGESPDYDIVSGERHDILRKVEENWKISERIILLDQSTISTYNLSMFL